MRALCVRLASAVRVIRVRHASAVRFICVRYACVVPVICVRLACVRAQHRAIIKTQIKDYIFFAGHLLPLWAGSPQLCAYYVHACMRT